MDKITHYQAQIRLKGHYFPQRGEITDQVMLELANNGTTPGTITPELRGKADRIKAALLAGRIVSTATADISPLTLADFEAGRLTDTTGSERL